MRLFWIGGGSVALVLGVAGILLPLLPTTPFLLLAAFCFARGSPRLHQWLVSHPRLGPGLEAWRRHGAIAKRSKMMAVALMTLALAISVMAGVSWPVIAVQAAVLAAVATFILTRPLPPH